MRPKNLHIFGRSVFAQIKLGQGLGSKMIRGALEEMRQQGYETCWLRTENPKNVCLYEHLGFQKIHTEIPSSCSGQQYWLMSQVL